MNWNMERIHLSQCKPLLSRNSQLKKKMNLVKKVKNIHSENIENLLNELSAENMEQFYSEIVESVLRLKIFSSEDLKNVIRLISIYSRDHKFTHLLYSSVNINNVYWHKIVLIELQIILDPTYDYIKDVAKLFDKSILKHKIFYIEYILKFHSDKKLLDIADLEKSKIGTLNLEIFDGKDTDRILNACREINLETFEQKTDNGFKQIIEAKENEFDFYNCKYVGDETFKVPRYAKDIVEYLKNNTVDVNKIDEISKFLRKSENVKMIPVIYNKLKHNMSYLPILARIIKNCGVICKKSVSKIVDDMLENRINNRTDLINGIFLVSELIKFRYISPNECFNLLEHFYKQKDIEICCLIMKNVSRFYLIDEQVNSRAREFLDKLIIFGNKCSNIECVYINDMITRIFPKAQSNTEDSIKGFISYYFQNNVFKPSGEIYEILQRNKKYVFLILCTPWKFKDIEFLCKIAQHFSLDSILIDFITFVINIIGSTYKLKTIAYTKFLSGLLRRKDSKKQESVIELFLIMNLKKEMKIRILIFLISGMTYYVKSRHIPFLRKECEKIKSVEIHNLLFNLCESIGYRYDNTANEDSLDEEIRLMENL